MKTQTTLKSLRDLPPEAVQIKDASPPVDQQASPQANDATGEDFREMMHRRYTTPFVSATHYDRWGLNE